MYSEYRNFKSFTAFQKTAKRMGLGVRKVSKNKVHIRYIAVSKADGIVGYFHNELGYKSSRRGAPAVETGRGYGHIRNAF